MRNASVTSVSIEDWERMLRIDLTGVFLVSRFALNEMVKAGRGGSVVHVSSVAGIVGDPKLAPYNAAKGGVNLLTKNMALDYAPTPRTASGSTRCARAASGRPCR